MKFFFSSLYGPLAKHPLSLAGACVITFFFLLSVYAPFFASSLPLAILYDNEVYFPLFRFLWVRSFFSKPIDLYFNSLIFLLPLFLLTYLFIAKQYVRAAVNIVLAMFFLCLSSYAYLVGFSSPEYGLEGEKWEKMLEAVRFENYEQEHNTLLPYLEVYKKRRGESKDMQTLPTLWAQEMQTLQNLLQSAKRESAETKDPSKQQQLRQLQQTLFSIKQDREKIGWMLMPLLSTYHWEDDAGGSQELNQVLPWWHLTRINRKCLMSALLFGGRISFTVGFLAVLFSCLIGIPIGAVSGYFGTYIDIAICRLMEIWESMPAFFMLLLIMAITQTKSIFLLVTVIAIFGWTGFARYVRAEVFKQKNAYYVEYCKLQGFSPLRILFREILPNSLTAVLTLIPFALVGAITSEAGLSFLGLGEENTCSWGSLMEEGRQAFPAESYLLWPPASFLTLLLVAFALMGDGIRDLLDPRSQTQR